MKKFLKRRWHGIPVGIISAVLAICLVAGGVFAIYNFLTVNIDVEVEEALVVAMWPAWDNLEPYGSVDDVEITLSGTALEPVVSITTIPGYAGAGFVAGECIVIPVNFRNAGDGELTLGASVDGNDGSLLVDYCWRTNNGVVTEVREPAEPNLARDFKANIDNDAAWAPLKSWSTTIAGKGGMSGSAVVGAKVLFVRICVPGDVEPNDYTFTINFNRS